MDERLIREGETGWGSYVFTFKTPSAKTKLGFHAIQIAARRPRNEMLIEAIRQLTEWEAIP